MNFVNLFGIVEISMLGTVIFLVIVIVLGLGGIFVTRKYQDSEEKNHKMIVRGYIGFFYTVFIVGLFVLSSV